MNMALLCHRPFPAAGVRRARRGLRAVYDGDHFLTRRCTYERWLRLRL